MTNIAILTGRIARDPETRETKGGTSVTGITPGTSHHADLSIRNHAQKAKQPAISAIAAPRYARKVII